MSWATDLVLVAFIGYRTLHAPVRALWKGAEPDVVLLGRDLSRRITDLFRQALKLPPRG